MTLLTFIIPDHHQANARDWTLLKANLKQTIASISNQIHRDWRAVIVANEGADLPNLPPHFDAVRVDFLPNDMHELGKSPLEEVYDAFRADKGRRVLAGMLHVPESRFFMIVDDDDFVSSRIVQHVSQNETENGWTVDQGYLWDHGGRLMLGHHAFNHLCGTSLIIRADLYGLPARFDLADIDWIRSMLGSHIRIADILRERGTPLASLPFRGAVYEVGHAGSHSKAPSLLVKHFFSWQALRQPRQMLRNLARLRLVDETMRREFFGSSPTDRHGAHV